ncbi:hypothetical protein L486_05065 [Kwoniella mangroviensis CBS 10435]|uniref:Uncharacterized protein n=1 Tax=Kwoniella mangroviensis CBS 10435 TaxID=1331196 RepID=A0A1B9IPW1_9TREE|nr:hypothetical protein L486_05065 [Kwoniella mangroviensis CBS 10435]
MTFHQVFLPPPTIQPFPPLNDNSKFELKFYTLQSSPIEHSQDYSQSLSLRNRLAGRDSTWIGFSQGGLESLEKSTILGKRPERSEEDNPDHGGDWNSVEDISKDVTGSADTSGFHPLTEKKVEKVIVRDFELEEGRRRSRRVTRQSISLLNTLPQIYPSAPPDVTKETQDESVDSLSTTTTSFPSQSQLLTNPGNTSVSNLPRWSIPLHRLSTLHSLLSFTSRGKVICSVIVCVLACEPIVQRQRKSTVQSGFSRRVVAQEDRVGSILHIGKWTVTAQPSAGEVELTSIVRLWDDCALEYGEKVRRGDVVLLENVEYKPLTAKEPSHISISPHHSPKITILYRTLPRYESAARNDYIYQPPTRLGKPPTTGGKGTRGRMLLEDKMLRPDLRLGRSEVGIRRVEGIARWFAEFVGGEGPG